MWDPFVVGVPPFFSGPGILFWNPLYLYLSLWPWANTEGSEEGEEKGAGMMNLLMPLVLGTQTPLVRSPLPHILPHGAIPLLRKPLLFLLCRVVGPSVWGSSCP